MDDARQATNPLVWKSAPTSFQVGCTGPVDHMIQDRIAMDRLRRYILGVCGRATLTSPAEDIARVFDAAPLDLGPPRYNLAPSQPMLTVRGGATEGGTGGRTLAIARWGLIPWWAKPEEAKKIASRCVQARSETVQRTRAFRDAFQRRRCLVVVDGFFEWRTESGVRLPHHACRPDRAPFAIAALWDAWTPPALPSGGPPPVPVESCAVLTMRAGGPIRAIHDRMPLVLAPDEWETWLAGSTDDAAQLLAQPEADAERRAAELVVVPVSTWVNDVRHDDPRCLAPRSDDAPAPPPQLELGFGHSSV